MRRDPQTNIPDEYREMVVHAEIYCPYHWRDMAARLTWLANWTDGDEATSARKMADDCHRRARDLRAAADARAASMLREQAVRPSRKELREDRLDRLAGGISTLERMLEARPGDAKAQHALDVARKRELEMHEDACDNDDEGRPVPMAALFRNPYGVSPWGEL